MLRGSCFSPANADQNPPENSMYSYRITGDQLLIIRSFTPSKPAWSRKQTEWQKPMPADAVLAAAETPPKFLMPTSF
jgi:hypothetical protein